MEAGSSGLELPAFQTFVRKAAVLSLALAAMGAGPIIFHGMAGPAMGAAQGNLAEEEKRPGHAQEKRPHEFKLAALGKLGKFIACGEDDVKKKGNGGDGKELKPEVKVNTGLMLNIHGASAVWGFRDWIKSQGFFIQPPLFSFK